MATPTITKRSSVERVQHAPLTREQRAPGYRPHERRWRDAQFFLVERRRGKAWMYGSIALAAALWTYIYLFVHFR
ncbi:MAG: hypothetical protein ACM3JC_04980 [Rudaea sp.]